jgi:hypothetical protein
VLKYLLIYSMGRVLLEKLTGSEASQEIPRILWNPEVHYITQKYLPSPCPEPTLSNPYSPLPPPEDPS